MLMTISGPYPYGRQSGTALRYRSVRNPGPQDRCSATARIPQALPCARRGASCSLHPNQIRSRRPQFYIVSQRIYTPPPRGGWPVLYPQRERLPWRSYIEADYGNASVVLIVRPSRDRVWIFEFVRSVGRPLYGLADSYPSSIALGFHFSKGLVRRDRRLIMLECRFLVRASAD